MWQLLREPTRSLGQASYMWNQKLKEDILVWTSIVTLL